MLSTIGVRHPSCRGVGKGTGEARYAGNWAGSNTTAMVATIKHGMLHGKFVFMCGMPEGGRRKMFRIHYRRGSRWGATRGSRGSIQLIT